MEAVIHGAVKDGQLPQEIEMWYVIPALRREYAKILLADHHLSQKQVAALLQVTEAAVSQYVSGKRADIVHFSDKVLLEIKHSAASVVNGHIPLFRELERISKLMTVRRIVCEMCKTSNKGLDDCTICFDEPVLKENVPSLVRAKETSGGAAAKALKSESPHS